MSRHLTSRTRSRPQWNSGQTPAESGLCTKLTSWFTSSDQKPYNIRLPGGALSAVSFMQRWTNYWLFSVLPDSLWIMFFQHDMTNPSNILQLNINYWNHWKHNFNNDLFLKYNKTVIFYNLQIIKCIFFIRNWFKKQTRYKNKKWARCLCLAVICKLAGKLLRLMRPSDIQSYLGSLTIFPPY